MKIENQNIIYKLTLILLFAAFAFHLGRHINDFYVPESDFFDFRDKAITLRNLEWPDNFKRPPLYAASVALLSSLIQGPNRELYAAEFIGVVAALASLLFIYKIAFYFFGRAAMLAAWLWAFHPSTIRMAVKPKSEILVTALILWAVYLFIKEKKWAYLVAFFASCVRYEGALAIAAVGAGDFVVKKEKLKTAVRSLLSGAFIVLWTALQSGGGEGESYFSYFNDYKPNIAFLKAFWDGLLGFVPDSFFRFAVLVAAGLMFLGFVDGLRRHRRAVIGLGVFLIGFLAMHIIWPMPNFDYQVLIVWNALLLIGLGVKWIAGKKFAIVVRFMRRKTVVIAAALMFALAVVALFRLPPPWPQYSVGFGEWLLFMTPAVMGLLAMFGGPGKLNLAPLFSVLLLLTPILFFMLSDSNALLYAIKYSKAEFRLVGEWFEENADAGDKLAVEQPVVVAYYTSKRADDFVRLVDLPKVEPDSLYRWCRDNGVTHIAWLSANRIFDTDNAWYRWKMDNRGWKTIAFLAEGRDSHGFVLVKEISIGPRRAFIYKI